MRGNGKIKTAFAVPCTAKLQALLALQPSRIDEFSIVIFIAQIKVLSA
jgi:hypothetical protein